MSEIYINDNFVHQNDGFVSIKDRGFRFGDGVFETIRLKNSIPYQFEKHLKRLESGLTELKISYNVESLEQICIELLEKNHVKNGFLRIAISRGCGSLGYLPDIKGKPTVVVETIDGFTKQGKNINLWLSKYKKIPSVSIPSDIKTMQGLNSTLARMEATQNDCFESLLLGYENQVCEASSANIFWVKDKIIYTPSPDCDILSGTIREAIIRISPFKVKEGIFTLKDVKNADEVFLTNVAWLVLPVNNFEPFGIKYNNFEVTEEISSLLKKDIEDYVSGKKASMG